MVKSINLQIKAILTKNFICSWRNREIITEILLPLIAALFVTLRNQIQQLTIFSPMFLAIAINSSGRSLLIHLVEEKCGRYKETQKVIIFINPFIQQIMGMKQRSYITGWIIFGYLKSIISTFILMVFWYGFNRIINSGDFGLDSEYTFSQIMGAYWLYAAASLNFSLMLSTIFSSPKLASEVTTFLTVLSTLLTFLLFMDKFQNMKFFYYGLSIFPSASISFAYISVLQFSLKSIFPSGIVRDMYPLKGACIQLGLESIFYFILYFYLDQVFPNEYGVSKHPLFFLSSFKCHKNKIEENSQNQDELSLPINSYKDQAQVPDESSAYYHEPLNTKKRATVIIRGLIKKFGDFTAVDRLSINLYENEILCLLGHNGAGKTTTISVLTGLLEKTSGLVQMYDLDLVEDLDQLREIIGICNQRDVLYEELTAEEHLIFLGTVKGRVGAELTREINEILDKTQLLEERFKITKELSGGSRRKLSLALALIGGSQVIFLDEPTSGMDAMSRRVIWQILERIKNDNRTLVLTTHHLDEAEILADRIAIMASGKLLACGTSHYIKENFGQGYELEVPKECGSIVENELKGAVLDPQSPANISLYQVPFSDKIYLKNLFHKLEQNFGEDVKVNLKMNSLEDAFVNIGMDEEKFLRRAKQSQARKSQFEKQHSEIQEEQKELELAIDAPDCLKRPPNYDFFQQSYAIFLRKWYTTIRTFSNYISTIVPFLLIVIGTIIINRINFDDLDKVPDDFKNWIKLVLVCFFIILAFCFNSSVYIMLPVLEREHHLKYALTVMGCRVLPYWFGTFIFDYLLFSIFVIVFIILSYILSLSFVTAYMGQIVCLFAVFGLAYITFSYLCGLLLYSRSTSAMKTFPLFNFFIMFCGFSCLWGITYFIQQKRKLNSLDYVIYTIDLLACLTSPFWTFNTGFSNIIQIQPLDTKQRPPVQLSTNPYFYALMMLVEFFLFSVLTIFLENRKYAKPKAKQIDTKKSIRVDQSVFAEEAEVRENNSEKAISTLHLKKEFDNGVLAIKDISFMVRQKEILGLLGPNSAGKSTIFSVLTSLLPKTDGSVKLKGFEVDRNEPKIFKDVGICPQFDCLWMNLTPKEHLYLFGRMKGLKGAELDESVNYFLQTMQLTEYTNRKAGQLSGGNKRKLCVSNALIGGPCIQFFDEPSTGVDPIARRFLWRTVKQGVQLRDSAVVITTHTMHEAESLCDRIAILVNGQFYCIGTPSDLRNKFGEGFTLLIKSPKNRQVVIEILKKSFPNCNELEEKRVEYMNVHVMINKYYNFYQKIPSEEFKFFKAFDVLESDLIEKNLIEDFSISQSSLEQVFIIFSQVEHE